MEILAVASLLNLVGDVEWLRELAETGFVVYLAIALYALRESERQEVNTLRRYCRPVRRGRVYGSHVGRSGVCRQHRGANSS